jgi:hypothetical protein
MRKVYNPFNTPLDTAIDEMAVNIPPRSEVLLPPAIARKLQDMAPGLEYPDGDIDEVKKETKKEKEPKAEKAEPKLKAKKVTPKKNEKKRK